MEHSNSAPAYGLWSLVIINSLVFRHLRVQFREAAEFTRLALVRRVFGLPRSAIHRDVRLSAYDLSALGLAHEQVPGSRFPFPRRRASARSHVRVEGKPPFRPVPFPELHLHRGWFLAALRVVEGSLRGAARASLGGVGALCASPASPVHRVRPDHVWVPDAMADGGHPYDVSYPCLHVCASGEEGRTGR